MKRGKFIVIDGIDGSGKSTQVRRLAERLGKRAVSVSDPGGTPSGEAIREIILHRGDLSPLSTLFLFFASRAALVEQAIAPAMRRGKVVISDRFDSSTFAYQVVAGRQPGYRRLIDLFRSEVLATYAPDAYIILDSDPKKAQKRLVETGKVLTTFDRKPLRYHQLVRAGFKAFKPRSGRVYVVDGDRDLDVVERDVWAIVGRYL